MSIVTLDDAKSWLRVIHAADDALIQLTLDGAEAEACRFCNRLQLPTLPLDYPGEYDTDGAFIPSTEDVPSSEDPIAPDVKIAVLMLTQAGYEATKPEDRIKMRSAAETILMPYRVGLGV